MTSQFGRYLDSGEFIVTCEIGPPKGSNIEAMEHHIDLLKDRVHAINVTDHQGSVMRLSSLAGSLAVKEHGAEPILQMTCRDRNRLALQADLLFAHTRGLNNILCLTGDAVVVGDHPEAKGVFDLDSVQLLELIQTMEGGRDAAGKKLVGGVDFRRGAVVTPGADPLEPQLIKFEMKVEAGAEFFQTQAVFDLETFASFMDQVRGYGVKVFAGILVLTSYRMARFVHENLPGIRVPDSLLQELKDAPKGEGLATGIDIAARTISALHEDGMCDGVHVMAINAEESVPEILDKAGL